MQSLKTEEIRGWCGPRGLRVSSRDFLYYETEPECCFSLGLEGAPSRVIALADHLIPTWEAASFEGALLWIRERGVWSDYSERVGALIVDQMAKGYDAESLEQRPGLLFGPEELLEMHSFLLIPMLFGWDAFLVPESMDYFLFVSHDGVVGVVSRTQHQAKQLQERVQDWSPREARTWYFKGRD